MNATRKQTLLAAALGGVQKVDSQRKKNQMSRLMKPLREIQLDEITRTQRIDCRRNFGESSLNLRPTCGRKNQNRE
jgi:hypothetical protein